jgi:hypothetical protein
MRKKNGGSKFVSSQFTRAKKRRAFDVEFDSLQDKISKAASRLGFDLSDDTATDRLFEVGTMAVDEDAWKSMDEAAYAERFLSLAYVQTIIIGVSSTDADIIPALCLGNWLVGILDGMPSRDATQHMCIPCIIKEYSSKIGKAGAEKKLAPMRELEQWAITQYRAKEWPSANKAAHDLKERVLTHGRNIGAILSEQNAQRTIADWIRKTKKMSA